LCLEMLHSALKLGKAHIIVSIFEAASFDICDHECNFCKRSLQSTTSVHELIAMSFAMSFAMSLSDCSCRLYNHFKIVSAMPLIKLNFEKIIWDYSENGSFKNILRKS